MFGRMRYGKAEVWKERIMESWAVEGQDTGEMRCGRLGDGKSGRMRDGKDISWSEQAPGSFFHPCDKSEQNYCDFLGPSWCNIKVDPER